MWYLVEFVLCKGRWLVTGTHATEDALERYSMGRVAEPELAELEEHLLVCELCQDRLVEEEDFGRATRAALRRLHREPKESESLWSRLTRRPRPSLVWAGGLACAMLALMLFHPRTAATEEVQLYAARGFEQQPAQVRSGSDVRLRINTTQLDPAPAWQVEVVDSGGQRVWQGDLPAGTPVLTANPGRLHSGQHWVRLYAAGDRHPVREFSLLVR